MFCAYFFSVRMLELIYPFLSGARASQGCDARGAPGLGGETAHETLQVHSNRRRELSERVFRSSVCKNNWFAFSICFVL